MKKEEANLLDIEGQDNCVAFIADVQLIVVGSEYDLSN